MGIPARNPGRLAPRAMKGRPERSYLRHWSAPLAPLAKTITSSTIGDGPRPNGSCHENPSGCGAVCYPPEWHTDGNVRLICPGLRQLVDIPPRFPLYSKCQPTD